MRTAYTFILLVCSLITSVSEVMHAQDQELAHIYVEFSTWKSTDMSRSLRLLITSENENGEYPVEDLPINFYMFAGTEEKALGTAVSGPNGIADLVIKDKSVVFHKDDEGYIIFYARFEGSEKYYATEEELVVKDVSISIRFEEEEDGKRVYFNGVVHGAEEDLPLADDDLYFYVPRMFSDMKIADGWFEEDGTGYIPFPTAIIGDSLGNILIMARIEDHYDYGNVEVSQSIDWAVPRVLIQAEGPARELWTPIAPLWMIITLIIMLAGVWGHYIYTIVQLIRIKRSKSP